MLGSIFAVIELVLRLFKLWDQFGVYMDDMREKERVARDQARDAAVDKQKTAESEADFDKAQDDIAASSPKP